MVRGPLSSLREAGGFVSRLHPRQWPPARPRHTPAEGLRIDSFDAVHSVIPELGADGQIDAHAAMTLRLAFAEAIDVDGRDVLIDLRDLTAIDDDAIAVLRWARDACRAHDLHLALLVGDRAPSDPVPHALARAGLTPEAFTDRAGTIPAPAPAPHARLRLLREHHRASKPGHD
jgi:anti-anti-sigma regulatory factor